MPNKTKIGVRVDEDVYNAFVEWVEETTGQRHGTVGSELTKAMEAHIKHDKGGGVERIESDIATVSANTANIIERIDRLEKKVEQSATDGGATVAAPTPSDRPTHTHTDHGPETAHTPTSTDADRTGGHDDDRRETADTGRDDDASDDDDDAPNRKAGVDRKADWVAGELLREDDAALMYPTVVETKVDETWSFGDRAKTKLLEAVARRYHATPVKSGRAGEWQVVIASSPEAVEDRVKEWADATDGDVMKASKTGEKAASVLF